MFCIRCGKKAEIGVYCRNCYYDSLNKELFKFRFKICGRCGKIKIGREWKGNLKAVSAYIENKLSKNFDSVRVDLDNETAIITKNNIDFEVPIDIKYEETTCEICSKIAGGYYEGEIQLRGKDIKNMLKIIISKFNKEENYYSIKNVKEGVDIKFFSSKKALEIIKDLGVEYKISRKLHTQIQGKRKYRLTILIRK